MTLQVLCGIAVMLKLVVYKNFTKSFKDSEEWIAVVTGMLVMMPD